MSIWTLHTDSFEWFLSGLEWILNLEFCLLKLLIFYQKLLWNIRSRFNSSTFWVFRPVFINVWSKSSFAINHNYQCAVCTNQSILKTLAIIAIIRFFVCIKKCKTVRWVWTLDWSWNTLGFISKYITQNSKPSPLRKYSVWQKCQKIMMDWGSWLLKLTTYSLLIWLGNLKYGNCRSTQ